MRPVRSTAVRMRGSGISGAVSIGRWTSRSARWTRTSAMASEKHRLASMDVYGGGKRVEGDGETVEEKATGRGEGRRDEV